QNSLRIGTEDAEETRLLADLFQRLRDTGLLRMAIEVHEEDVIPLLAPRRPGFDPGHVDLVARERLEQMKEHARPLRSARGDEQGSLVLAARGKRLAADDEEPGRIVRLVLDVAEQHVEAIHLGCGLTGNRRRAFLVARAARGLGVARDDDLLD